MIEKQITTHPSPPYWGNYAILNNNHPVMRTACCGFCGALLNFSALIKMKSQISQQLLSSGRMTCRLHFGEIIFFIFLFFEKLCCNRGALRPSRFYSAQLSRCAETRCTSAGSQNQLFLCCRPRISSMYAPPLPQLLVCVSVFMRVSLCKSDLGLHHMEHCMCLTIW